MLFGRLLHAISNVSAQLWRSGTRMFLTGCGVVGLEFGGVCGRVTVAQSSSRTKTEWFLFLLKPVIAATTELCFLSVCQLFGRCMKISDYNDCDSPGFQAASNFLA